MHFSNSYFFDCFDDAVIFVHDCFLNGARSQP